MTLTPNGTALASGHFLEDLAMAFDHAPWAVVELTPEAHVVHYANLMFCGLLGKAQDDVLGKRLENLLPPADKCLELLEGVYRTGKATSFIGADEAPFPLLHSYVLWPVVVEGRTAGVMIQVSETGPVHEARRAISEALLIRALSQDERMEATDAANSKLKLEVLVGRKAEYEARMMNTELSHRLKNNLAIVSALIASEIKRTPEPWVQGYRALQGRVMAIAQLYDLMSQGDRHRSVDLAIYLREIVKGLKDSVLAGQDGIRIVVEADSAEINSERAVPFGLLVNELSTNAAKYAFPDGVGQITLSLRMAGNDIVLVVADDGIGISESKKAGLPGKHGSDYVAIFVSQLDGALTRSTCPGSGTTFTIRFPQRDVSDIHRTG